MREEIRFCACSNGGYSGDVRGHESRKTVADVAGVIVTRRNSVRRGVRMRCGVRRVARDAFGFSVSQPLDQRVPWRTRRERIAQENRS